MYDFTDYIKNKKALVQKMTSVKNKISELKEFEIDVTEPLRKIDNAIAIISEEKISVVLVGAFSDGKTSVAAGWLNEKMSDMKIDSDESSDEILCYTPSSIPDGCQIVDTPGLFGDKIGADENGAKIALSDITRKYISEANLILYVVTAKNPIKEPIIAETIVITNDSPTIIVNILVFDHPTAFKTPISLVLSNTLISIVLIMPNPPTTIAKSEIAHVDA